jgi:glycosyltransferase involved in cell wall biosynthesis
MTIDLSVVMPVKNAMPYLDEAIQSVLEQSWSSFEFVIRDDGSTDDSRSRLRDWARKDARIRLFESDSSLGPSGSSNWVVRQARGSIIARMDADDISEPDRLEKQLSLMRANPEVVLTGSIPLGIDHLGRVVRPADLSTIASRSFSAPFAHGSIMFSKASFDQCGGYREECRFWEDLDFYRRMASLGRILVGIVPIYRHRFSETSTRLTSPSDEVERAVNLMFLCRAAANRGEDYEPLLRAAQQNPAAKIHPDTFVSLSMISVGAAVRPKLLVRMLRRAHLRLNRSSARALLWMTFATLWPRGLRSLLRTRAKLRHQVVDPRILKRGFYEWTHGTGLASYEPRDVPQIARSPSRQGS